jgi:hypothetical protein
VVEIWNRYEWIQTDAASVHAHKVISTDQNHDVSTARKTLFVYDCLFSDVIVRAQMV